MTQAREGAERRGAAEAQSTVSNGAFILGVDESGLTPLDALDERLKKGERWIQSDTVHEVRQ